MRLRYLAPLIIVACCGVGCHRSRSTDAERPRQVTVAAAANLMDIAQTLASAFEAQTKIHPVFSFGSTAQLTQQIENSAPFDVFMAADAEHVDILDREGLLLPGSNAVYATGVLALWIPPASRARVNQLQDLAADDVHVIAVANPKLAPYGAATVEALQHAGLWDRVMPKIVYAENISMAKQYGQSKNADAVFTAYSLVLKEPGKTIQIGESMHQPIVQKLGVLARSDRRASAESFAAFVLHGAGRDILRKYGYHVQ